MRLGCLRRWASCEQPVSASAEGGPPWWWCYCSLRHSSSRSQPRSSGRWSGGCHAPGPAGTSGRASDAREVWVVVRGRPAPMVPLRLTGRAEIPRTRAGGPPTRAEIPPEGAPGRRPPPAAAVPPAGVHRPAEVLRPAGVPRPAAAVRRRPAAVPAEHREDPGTRRSRATTRCGRTAGWLSARGHAGRVTCVRASTRARSFPAYGRGRPATRPWGRCRSPGPGPAGTARPGCRGGRRRRR